MKYLLGAVVGDILHSTFSDKKYVYSKNNTLLSDKSKISGYTVITLAAAKYIMEYNHLYDGPIIPGRSEKRKDILCKTILDLAKSHPDLEYPEWLNKWLTSDKCLPTKDADCWAGLCLVPLVIYFMHRGDMESSLRMLAESISVITTDKNSILGAKAVATAIYSIRKYREDTVTQDFMACLYNIRWEQNLSDIDSKYGWNTSLLKAIVPALSVFFHANNGLLINSPVTDLREALNLIEEIGGLTTLVTPIFATMIQAIMGLRRFDEQGGFRDLLPKDLLEINDKFFEFMRKLEFDYDEDNYLDNESETGPEPDENGCLPFSDLLKLL